MLNYFLIGAFLGLSAGISPGPLLTLVVTETLRHGNRAGVRVAFAPLITDLPIIACAVLVLTMVADADMVLAALSFCGAGFVAWMGLENLRSGAAVIDMEKHSPRSLSKGIFTNLLSPHPYLFWLTVGVPIMSQASQKNYAHAATFLVSFYFLLVGSKTALALLVGKFRFFLNGRAYTLLLRALGGVLCLFSAFLLYEGVRLLGSHQ